ncbi:hypothetical protein WR25_09706 [Diploscapter pachys]|uniref:Uncharacterized protein n=1 Tax=Diploscapter pachys TaxID=2018661 RepID=A0A2A2KKJ0_9BILA|nr:hypothetical protein WR25_09706 [Diploscapter pachys]
MTTSLATPRWAGSACPTISARPSPCCWKMAMAGSAGSGWRCRGACSSEAHAAQCAQALFKAWCSAATAGSDKASWVMHKPIRRRSARPLPGRQ